MKNYKNIRFLDMGHLRVKKLLLVTFCIGVFFTVLSCGTSQNATSEFLSTGHEDIDRVRKEMKETPTDSLNYKERIHTLSLWIRLLTFSGADLNLDPSKHQGHFNFPKEKLNSFSEELAAEIDYQFAVLENLFVDFVNEKDQLNVSLDRDPKDNNGKVYDWPYLRGNPAQTAFTDSPGPMKGELLWKFPSPHAWYARPAFDDGKVFMGSPGISYEAYCVDAKTGKYVWKTLPKETEFLRLGSYGPRASSSVVNTGKHILFRKIQVNGYREHIVYINKETGEKEKGIINNEFLNSSSGYAPLVGNDKYLVYPQGIQPEVQQPQKLFVDQEKYRKIREDFPFDSLVCRSTHTGSVLWQKYMGEFYAEPLLDEERVFCGNMAGDFRCYDAFNGNMLWEVKTGSPINAMPAADEHAVFVGNRSGQIFAFNKSNGKQIWTDQLPDVPNAFQVFSRFYLDGNNAYVGSADKNLYCYDTKAGNLKWKIMLDDWIRSAPLVLNETVFVATMSGKMYSIKTEGDNPKVNWEKEVSLFPVFADLTTYMGDIYVSTSDLYLVNVDAKSGDINWQTSTFERVHDEKGKVVLADIVGQPDNQSSVMIVDGTGYFGTQRFVYALDIESGKELWKYEVRGQVCGAPVVDNGMVFFGQRGGTPNFYCLDATTGELIWKKRVGHVWASAHFQDDRLYLNTEGGVFMCVNETDGELIWEYDTGLKGLSYNTPAIYGELIYFGNEHEYYAFNKDNGELVWTFNIGNGKTDSGTCMIEDDIFYCGGLWGDRFYAVDAFKGTLIWDYELESCNTPPTTDGKFVIFNTHHKRNNLLTPDETVCLDAKTGEFKYKHLFGGLSGPAIGNNLVFATSVDGPFIKAWDIDSGEIRWSYLMGGRAEESCVTIYGDKAFIIASDGYVYAFH